MHNPLTREETKALRLDPERAMSYMRILIQSLQAKRDRAEQNHELTEKDRLEYDTMIDEAQNIHDRLARLDGDLAQLAKRSQTRPSFL